jgi:two-component system response regulator AtoC
VRAQLGSYSWPGNIRELRNVIERALALAGDEEIALWHLPLEKMTAPATRRVPPRSSVPPPPSIRPPPSSSNALTPELPTDAWPVFRPPSATGLKAELEALEHQRILDALEQCDWNQTRAAQLLGMTRGVFMLRLDQYGIARPRKR